MILKDTIGDPPQTLAAADVSPSYQN